MIAAHTVLRAAFLLSLLLCGAAGSAAAQSIQGMNSIGTTLPIGANNSIVMDVYSNTVDVGTSAVTTNRVGVGLGTAVPASIFQVNGEVQVGNTGAACTLATLGAMRYNASINQLQICGTCAVNASTCPTGYNYYISGVSPGSWNLQASGTTTATGTFVVPLYNTLVVEMWGGGGGSGGCVQYLQGIHGGPGHSGAGSSYSGTSPTTGTVNASAATCTTTSIVTAAGYSPGCGAGGSDDTSNSTWVAGQPGISSTYNPPQAAGGGANGAGCSNTYGWGGAAGGYSIQVFRTSDTNPLIPGETISVNAGGGGGPGATGIVTTGGSGVGYPGQPGNPGAVYMLWQ